MVFRGPERELHLLQPVKKIVFGLLGHCYVAMAMHLPRFEVAVTDHPLNKCSARFQRNGSEQWGSCARVILSAAGWGPPRMRIAQDDMGWA